MGLKRSPSCDDRSRPRQDSKKLRRGRSSSRLAAKANMSSTTLVDSSFQIKGSDGCIAQGGGKLANTSKELAQEHVQWSAPVSNWIENLPKSPTEFDIMAQALPKRPRSNSDASISLSDDDSNSEARRNRTDLYKDPRCTALLASKRVFLRSSPAGPLPEEIEYLDGLLSSPDDETDTIEIEDPVLDGRFLRQYVDLLAQSSKLRLCVDLHARLVPSAEMLSLQHQGTPGDLAEGYNDRWLPARGFLSKLPQPDHTVAFRAEVFTDLERQKLRVQSGTRRKSLYAACEGMLFPFLTCEIKAEIDGLPIAMRANANSMAVALRGVVDLFRRANIETEIHRKILGITISHNASTVEIYGHYPEIDGEETAYYQYCLRAFNYSDRNGADRYTSSQFVNNVYTQFAKKHLQRLRDAIGKLETPSRPEDLTDIGAKTSGLMGPPPPASATRSERSTATSSQGLTQKAQIALLTQDVENLRRIVQEAKDREAEAKTREAELIKLLSDRQSAIR